ncbi:CopM family metallochaperone [Methylobacterium sp. CM6247]
MVLVALMATGVIGGGMMWSHPSRGAFQPQTSFDALMTHSMERMHADMALDPSGDPDRDFAAMMIPHHQGAIDMAKAELAFGRNPILRRLAQGILVEQQQEIMVMQGALADLPSPAKGRNVRDDHHHGATEAGRSDHAHGETGR